MRLSKPEEWVSISARIEVAREKAYKITLLDAEEHPIGEAWLPRSQMRDDHDYQQGDLDVIEVTEWIAEQEGW